MKITKLTAGSNLLWESSRMILPEYRNELLLNNKQINKKLKPLFDEQRIEELSQLISEAIENDSEVRITVYHSYQEAIATGKIKKVDPYLKQIRIINDNEDVWIKFDDLLNIEINS